MIIRYEDIRNCSLLTNNIYLLLRVDRGVWARHILIISNNSNDLQLTKTEFLVLRIILSEAGASYSRAYLIQLPFFCSIYPKPNS